MVDRIQELTKGTKKHKQADPDPARAGPDILPTPIMNFLTSMTSGAVSIHVENQPFLKLTISQSDTDKIKVEFGQKFIEMSLAIGLNRLFDSN
jgi:hypothetical protein